MTECKVPEGVSFLGGGVTDPEDYEQPEDYWCCCNVCGEPIPEDWTSTCFDCFHLPMRRRVWGKLDDDEKKKWWNEGEEYGLTYSHKNWVWIPYGDGSGEGEIVRKPRKKRLKPIDALLVHLERAGYHADSIKVTRGYWSHRQQDCWRWQTIGAHTSTGRPVVLYSYDTVTDCARKGITFRWVGGDNIHIEVSRK